MILLFALSIYIFSTKEVYGDTYNKTILVLQETISQSSYDKFNTVLQDEVIIDEHPRFNLYSKLVDFPSTGEYVKLPTDTDPRTAGQCVLWVKWITGLNYSGDAKDWIKYINSKEPKNGSIVVIDSGYWGHIGIQVRETNDTIIVKSRN